MCGIAGFITGQTADAAARAARMTGALAHRGPDDAGTVGQDNVWLGHRRLSIIDLSAQGHQPMADAADETAWIVFNGEIYNFNDARAALADRGYRFKSHTDTEVLLALYREYGAPALFPHLNGMFAFAIHDRARRKVLLARDRLGVKPLYYAVINGELLFASELKAIFAALGGQPSLRADALGQYFLQGYVSAPATAFENVFLLPPGHYLEIDVPEFVRDGRGVPAPVEYWDAPFTGDDARPVAVIQEELAELLSDAVRLRMIADVPLGAFLSGGIDSSAIVALMARNNAQPVRTFCVDVPGTDRSEREKAAAVAAMYRTAHTEIVSDAAGAEDYWARLAHYDQPFNCPSLLNTWLVSRAARKFVTVALSGDGGDELFAGYTRYLEVARRAQKATPAAAATALLRPLLQATGNLLPHDLRGRARLAERGMDDFTYFFTLNHPLSIADAERLTGASLRAWTERMRAVYERYPADSAVTRACYFDLKNYLADHINAKVDNASMAVSLEVRTPFLDYRVVELAGRIPAALKIKNGTGKWILKDLINDWLPAGLTAQKKVGFDPPLAQWAFDASLGERLDELTDAGARWRGLLDDSLIERWIGRLQRRTQLTRSLRVPQRAALWALYQFEQWLALQTDGGNSSTIKAETSAIWRAQPCSPVPSTRI